MNYSVMQNDGFRTLNKDAFRNCCNWRGIGYPWFDQNGDPIQKPGQSAITTITAFVWNYLGFLIIGATFQAVAPTVTNPVGVGIAALILFFVSVMVYMVQGLFSAAHLDRLYAHPLSLIAMLFGGQIGLVPALVRAALGVGAAIVAGLTLRGIVPTPAVLDGSWSVFGAPTDASAQVFFTIVGLFTVYFNLIYNEVGEFSDEGELQNTWRVTLQQALISASFDTVYRLFGGTSIFLGVFLTHLFTGDVTADYPSTGHTELLLLIPMVLMPIVSALLAGIFISITGATYEGTGEVKSFNAASPAQQNLASMKLRPPMASKKSE